VAKSASINIFEVGPRDGLQNEKKILSTDDKAWFVAELIAAGVRDLELGAFVRTDKVPQMADTDQLYELVRTGALSLDGGRAWALVPNLKGLERAIQAGVKHIAVFTAATESFTKNNIGMTIDESFEVFGEVIREAKRKKIRVRGYVSTVFGCPFEGEVPPKKALKVIERLGDLGVEQVSIGDTIGVATPKGVEQIVKPSLKILGAKRTAVHFHDTRGTALANALRALELGVRTFDSSAGGLGGCPFAPGASGNLATEDLVYMMNGLGMKSGIDLKKLSETSLGLSSRMGRALSSRYLQAYAVQCGYPLP